jgi:hypothetical protein
MRSRRPSGSRPNRCGFGFAYPAHTRRRPATGWRRWQAHTLRSANCSRLRRPTHRPSPYLRRPSWAHRPRPRSAYLLFLRSAGLRCRRVLRSLRLRRRPLRPRRVAASAAHRRVTWSRRCSARLRLLRRPHRRSRVRFSHRLRRRRWVRSSCTRTVPRQQSTFRFSTTRPSRAAPAPALRDSIPGCSPDFANQPRGQCGRAIHGTVLTYWASRPRGPALDGR